MDLLHRREPDLLNLARAHWWLQRIALIVFALTVCSALALAFFAPDAVASHPLVWRWWGYTALLALAGLSIQTLRVGWLTGASPAELAGAAVALCIPLVNLCVIIGYDNHAAALIRAHGARVGFFGTGEAELPRIADGRCVRCDYDLAGIAGAVCPECGHDNTAPAISAPPAPPGTPGDAAQDPPLALHPAHPAHRPGVPTG